MALTPTSCSSTSVRRARPGSARAAGHLILELGDSLGATIVVVTHEAGEHLHDREQSVFLDPDAKTMLAAGDPKELRDGCPTRR